MMNDELGGLASKGIVPSKMTSVKDVVAMLMQGMEPEELVQNGIPEELVQQAMQVLMQQMSQEQQEPVSGLAGTRVPSIPEKVM